MKQKIKEKVLGLYSLHFIYLFKIYNIYKQHKRKSVNITGKMLPRSVKSKNKSFNN